MPEFPDANSGGLDPSGVLSCKPPRRRRLRSYLTLAFACAIILGMAIGAGVWLFAALRPGHPWDDRLLHLIGAVGLFTPLFVGIRAYIKARRKGGRTVTVCSAETRGPLPTGPGVGKTDPASLLTYAFKWAGYAAMQPSFPVWQRTVAWLVLLVYALFVLGVGVMGIVGIVAGLGSLPGGLWMAGMGALVLYLPFTAIRSLVRGIRAGKLGPTREELEQFRAAHDAWRTAQRRMPLQSKILAVAFSLGILAFLWLYNEHRHPGQGGNWIVPAMWLPGVAYTLWVQFGRPQSKSDE